MAGCKEEKTREPVVLSAGDWALLRIVGDLKIVLIDPAGRRDAWEGESQVSAIPNCTRTLHGSGGIADPQTNVGLDAEEATEFELKPPVAGVYLIEAQATAETVAVLSLRYEPSDGAPVDAREVAELVEGGRVTWEMRIGRADGAGKAATLRRRT